MRLIAALALAAPALTAAGSIVPFTEDFNSGANNWLSADFLPAGEVATGGIDNSGYITTQTSFEFSDPGAFNVVFRGNTGFFPGTDASDGNFFGDWIAGGVTEVSFSIRHNISVPTTFFARIAKNTGGAAFPGAVAVAFTPVVAGEWTTLTLDVSALSSQIVSFGGSDYDTIFSDVGFLQIGLVAPDALLGNPELFDIDIDNISIVPAPAGLALLVPGLVAVRRRR